MQREAEMGKNMTPARQKKLSSCPGPARCLAKIPDLRFHDILHIFLTNFPLCLSELESV